MDQGSEKVLDSCTFAMKNFISIGLFCYLCIFKWGCALYSKKELLIYNVFLKPFGISFNDGIILKVSPDFGKCPDLKKSFENCSSTSTKLASSTTPSELSKLKSLSKSCPSGSYNCFYNYTVKSDDGLKEWFKGVQTTVRSLCKLQCWKTTQLFTNSSCIQSTGQSIKESDIRYIRFVNDALNSLCIQQEKLSCADKFINGLLKNSSDSDIQVCNVSKNLEDKKCSSACHKDVGDFYNHMECCIGSVTSIMDCYNVKPQEGSYGVFVKESSRCNLKTPPACSSSRKCPFTPPPPQSSSESPVSSSSKGKEIVGICVAVLICTAVALIAGNYMYRRFKRKQRIRFEDYGYSRLKMLEDDFYHDVEDDDENTGLVLQS